MMECRSAQTSTLGRRPRFVWTMAALYNRYEPRPAFLDAARKTIDFLLTHCRDENGWLVYRTTRAGRAMEGATSTFIPTVFWSMD
jgi:mannose/cellobiose epimerase-like protein (N-acyl-D-glucosamine 2-epimerase family)